MNESGRTIEDTTQENALLKRKISELEQSVLDCKLENSALRESEEKYRTLLARLPDPVFSCTADGQYIYANAAFGEMLNKPVEQIIGSKIWDVFSKKKADMGFAALNEVVKTGEQNVVEVRIPHGHADQYYLTTLTPVKDSAGKTVSVICSYKDITGRHHAEEELRKAEGRFRAFMDNIPDFVIIKDKDSRPLFFNRRFNETFKTGKLPEAIYSAHRVSSIRETDLKALAEGVIDYEIEWRDKKGRVNVVDIRKFRIEQTGKEPLLGILASDITERKQTEEKARLMADFLNSIVENIPDMIFIKDAKDHRFTLFNRAGEELLGYSRDEMLGKNDYDLFTKEQADFFFEKDREVLFGKQVVDIPYEPINTRCKGERFIHTKKVPITDEAGEPLYLLGISEDITERVRAEEALKESEEKFRVLADSTPTGVMLYQHDRWIYANKAAQAISGYSEEELREMNFWDIVHPSARDIIKQEGRKRQTGENTINRHEFKIITKDGTPKWVDLSGASTTLNGKLAGIISALDVTDRKKAETDREKLISELQKMQQDMAAAYGRLKQSEEMFSTVFRLTPANISLSSLPDGRYVEANDAWFKTTEFTREEAMGHTSSELNIWVRPEDRKSMLKLIEKGNVIQNQEYIFQSKSGKQYSCLFTAALIEVSGVPHLLSIATDISELKRMDEERKKLEERLLRSEKMEAIGQLAGGVAHDLNNALGVLVGYSELLKMQLSNSSQAWTYAESIYMSAIRCAAIIQDLLTLARRGVAVSEVVDLNELVDNYLETPELEKLKFDHPGVNILTSLEPGLLNIKGSPVHLGKTIMNLISNAAEAIPGPGSIIIRTENRYIDRPVRGYDEIKEGDYVVLTVSDTGSGISAADQGKIFEPFYTKKVMGRSGTGLGLAVVWGTVKDHHGYIDVQSEESRGTVFTLYFPATREEVARADEAIPLSEYAGHGESILVIDDIREQRDLVVRMLSKLNYRASAVSSGEEAVEYLKTETADLLVLDMIMGPGMDGLDAYKAILALRPKQKAIIVSGFAQTDRVMETQALGAGEYLRKPYVMEKLGLAVRKELDRK